MSGTALLLIDLQNDYFPGGRMALEGSPAAVAKAAAALAAFRARGLPVSPVGVAVAYAPWLRTLVIDRQDEGCGPELGRLGVTAVVADTLMTDRGRETALARVVLGA